MLNFIEFVMVSALFADLAVTRGAQFVTWVKGAFTTAEADVKKVV